MIMLSRHTRTSRSEERYRSLIAATAQLVWMTDVHGNVIEDIPTWRAFTGQTEEEVKGQGWINALHPDDRAPTAAVWAHAIRTRSYYATEYRLRRRDGEFCHFMVRGVPLLKKDGSIREWMGTCTNITEWKQVQEELFNSRQMLQLVLDNIPQRVFWKDRNSVYLGCNRPFAQDVDYSDPGTIVGKTDYELGAVTTANARRHGVDDRQVMESGVSKLNCEESLTKPDGTQSWFMTCRSPLRDQNGDVIGVLGSYEDITVRKQAEAVLRREQNARLQREISRREEIEESLREGKQELDEAQRLARVGSWVWEPAPERVFWSEEMFYIFGYDSALPALGFREMPQFFTSESWKQLDAAVEDALQSGTSYQLDLEIIRKNGQRAWITARGEAQRDASARIIGLRGSVQDISERKRAEEELQGKTAFFEALVHGSFDGILVVDSQGKQILQNQRTVELWEIPPDIANDLDDKKQVQFIVEARVKDPGQFFAKVDHLYSHPNEISRDEIELKSGTVLDRYSSPVINGEGKHYGRIWTFRDITERKRAEEALKKAHGTLEQRVQERTAELKIANEQLGRSNRLLRILMECNQQVVHAKDENELLREICRIIVGPGGYPSVWIGFAGEDDAKTVRPVAQEGFEDEYLDTIKITWADTSLGHGPTGTAIRSGHPAVVEDIRTSVNFAPWREEATQRGYVSAIGLPLRGHGRTFGALTIYACTLDAFPPGEVGALMELADDLAYGIMSLRAQAERKQAEMEIQRLNADLEKRVAARTAELVAANQELETFNYSASHDLRAPLRAVDSFSRYLQDEYASELSSDARSCLDRISAAAVRMDQLIKGLLNLSQVGRATLHFRTVNLSTLATAIATELKESESQRDVRFTITPDLRVEGDPDLLRSVLQNLIGNAWKYTSKHKSAHVEFGVEQTGGKTVFHVRDDGVGFKPEHVGKLFTAFQRLHGVDEFPGTGIGLTIVKRILQRHGGHIWAEGAQDKGATFYFTIPARKCSQSTV